MWIARAIDEARRAPMSWLFTGTFKEEPNSREAVVAEGQRFLKRLRRGRTLPVMTHRGPIAVPGAKVRFLSVVERGDEKDRLHWHCLVHGDGEPVRWLQLRTAWHAGHMHARRLHFGRGGDVPDDMFRQIAYVAGYLGKQGGRVVASLHYGRTMTPPTRKGPDKDRDPKRKARSPQENAAPPQRAPRDDFGAALTAGK